tara:strand:- start:534 stop:782 length:249 start_codon:yes stop_codon:yes gene_type:complete
MIVTIKNDDGIISYDINSISDEQKLKEAKIIVSKVGNLETVTEALSFASATHRANLERLLDDSPEALVEESTTEEGETSDKE